MNIFNFEAVVKVEFEVTIVNHIVFQGVEGLSQLIVFGGSQFEGVFREVWRSFNSRVSMVSLSGTSE